jgi:UDP-N-acetylglucosamine--N-acetylmuramyl-(pentapeptide) pyrophosphoryl-undecaprenol N-acetylglucosamine transferase
MEEIRLCLTGGSTGGHFFPLLFVAQKFKKEADKRKWRYKIFYLGAPPFDEELLKKEEIDVYKIPSAKLRRYFDIKNFFDILKFPFGFIKAFINLYLLMPNVIFSKGGPSSLEVVIAGWILRIPIIIHESDSIPGRSNIIAGKFATLIGVNFEKAKKYFNPKKTALIGQPLRDDFDDIKPHEEDYRMLNIESGEKIILVLGGSQGSQMINENIIFSLKKLLTLGHVIHQIGKNIFKEYYQIANGYILENVPARKKFYHPFAFIENKDLIKFLKMADLVISRAGAGAIFEIAASGLPAILIPLRKEVGGLHQIENAYEYANAGAAIVIEEQNLFPDLLATIVNKVLREENTLLEMKKNALSFSKKNATENIVKELILLITEE